MMRWPAKGVWLGAILVVALALSYLPERALAVTGYIWTDGTGDGLPDPQGCIYLMPCAIRTLDLWIDSRSFVFTTFVAWAEWEEGLSYVPGSAAIIAAGCTPDSIDRHTQARSVGFYGHGCALHGVNRMATFQLRVDNPQQFPSVGPLIDVGDFYGRFSVLWSGSSYFLFANLNGTCLGCVDCYPCPTGTEAKTWGAVKGLYR